MQAKRYWWPPLPPWPVLLISGGRWNTGGGRGALCGSRMLMNTTARLIDWNFSGSFLIMLRRSCHTFSLERFGSSGSLIHLRQQRSVSLSPLPLNVSFPLSYSQCLVLSLLMPVLWFLSLPLLSLSLSYSQCLVLSLLMPVLCFFSLSLALSLSIPTHPCIP